MSYAQTFMSATHSQTLSICLFPTDELQSFILKSTKSKEALLHVYKRNWIGNEAAHQLSGSTLYFAALEHPYSYIRLLNRARQLISFCILTYDYYSKELKEFNELE